MGIVWLHAHRGTLRSGGNKDTPSEVHGNSVPVPDETVRD